MGYEITLAETAYDLAARWDAARSTDIAKLDFKKSDLDEFNSNQKGTLRSILATLQKY